MGIQAENSARHWAAMRDETTYYALRDGKRLHPDKTALKTLRLRMSSEQSQAADWLTNQFNLARGLSGGSGERVDGGAGNHTARAMDRATDACKAAEGAIQAVGKRTMVRHGAAILREACENSASVPALAKQFSIAFDTAADRLLRALTDLAAYLDDCSRDRSKWASGYGREALDMKPEFKAGKLI